MALKALLVIAGESPPRTHNLVSVYERLSATHRPAAVTIEEMVRWTHYAVASRYPGFGDAQAEADLPGMFKGVSRLVAEARRIIAGPVE